MGEVEEVDGDEKLPLAAVGTRAQRQGCSDGAGGGIISCSCAPPQTQAADPNLSCQGRFLSPWWLLLLSICYFFLLP